VIVATKIDRLSANELKKSLDALAQRHPQATILPFSARTNSGCEELWREIRAAVQKNLPMAR
jgi:GTPase Era involved in 16S rRNA processing